MTESTEPGKKYTVKELEHAMLVQLHRKTIILPNKVQVFPATVL